MTNANISAIADCLHPWRFFLFVFFLFSPRFLFQVMLLRVELSQGGFQGQRKGNVNFLWRATSKLHVSAYANTWAFIKCPPSAHSHFLTRTSKQTNKKNLKRVRLASLATAALNPVGKFKYETMEATKRRLSLLPKDL